MKSILMGIVLLKVLSAPLAFAQVSATARIGVDGLAVEFVFSNAGSQASQCEFASVDVQYNALGNPVMPAYIGSISLPPGANGLVIPQPEEQLSALRSQYGLTIKAVTISGEVQLDCSQDQSERVALLTIDDRGACNDDRTMLTSYKVDLKLRKIAVTSPPIPLPNKPDEMFAHDQGLPVVYGLHLGSTRQISSYIVNDEGIRYLGTLDLPPAPTGRLNFQRREQVLPFSGAAFLDKSSLLLAYQPATSAPDSSDDNKPEDILLRLDIIELDVDTGKPENVSRKNLKFALMNNADLFFSRSIHTPGIVQLYMASPPINKSMYGPMLEQTPTDTFESPHKENFHQQFAIRFDASKINGDWGFAVANIGNLPPVSSTSQPFVRYDMFAHQASFLSSKAKTLPTMATTRRIDNAIIERTVKDNIQKLRVWSVPDAGRPVVSQVTSTNDCDSRLLVVDNRSYSLGEVDQNAQDTSGKTRLHHLTYLGNLQGLRNWLERDPDLNIRDNSEKTPVMIAIEKNRGELLNALLAAGADFYLEAPGIGGRRFDPLSYVVVSACDTCIAPMKEHAIAFDKVVVNSKEVPFQQYFCGIRGFDQTIKSRILPSPEILDKLSPEIRQRLQDGYDAWLASDPAPIRRSRMQSELDISCTPVQ